MKVLVVDDEKDTVDLVALNLEREGYKVITAQTGEDALQLVKTDRPDLILLDLMLPGIQGLEVCKVLRSDPECSGIVIVILSAKDSEVDRVLGLELGADDYITKPFSVRELIARVRVGLRRCVGPGKEIIEDATVSCNGLSIDFEKYEVRVKGEKIELSTIQLKLLFFLVKNGGRVVTRAQLIHEAWGEVFVTQRNVDVHISRLRRLIEPDPQRPRYIVTVASVGYRFNDSPG